METNEIPETACMRVARLKKAREEIVLGTGAQEIEHESGNGVRERVAYGKSDLPRLESLIAEAANECAIELGMNPVRRRPIIGARLGSVGRP